MKRTIAIILTVLICACVFSGFVGNSIEVTSDGSEVSNSVSAEQTPVDFDILTEKEFVWDDGSFKFKELTSDLGAWKTQLVAPKGKWVIAVFSIIDGKIECGRLEELILTEGGIKLDDYLPKTISEQGISIGDDMEVYAVGTINVFFDVDKDYDIANAKIYVNADATGVVEEDADDDGTAVLMLGDKEVQLGISDIQIDADGILTVVIDGLTISSPWRKLDVYAVVDGEKYFLEKSSVNQDGYERSSFAGYDKLPEQLILCDTDNEQSALIYDVTAGRFADESEDAEGTDVIQEVTTVPGISVEAAVISKPADGKLAFVPSGEAGYFAIDGTLKAQTTINVTVNPNGVLNYDLSLNLDSPLEVNAEIRVYKNGELLNGYSETAVSLPAGETVINACIKTNESELCSGEYTVQFYINDNLIAEDTDTI